MMKPICDACSKGSSVAEVTSPAVGKYSACHRCMSDGTRPPCHNACGRQGEFKADGVLWCTECHDSARLTREEASRQRALERGKAAEEELNARIAAEVARQLVARGL